MTTITNKLPEGTPNPFDVQYMTCAKCHKRRKQYKDFESQWTALSVEGEKKFTYICPTCWGIHDPASSHCFVYGHDFENGSCARCGRLEVQPK